MSKKNTPADFWARVSDVGKDGVCWEWQGNVCARGSHGDIKYQGKRWYAHRLAYFLTHGTIPQGHAQQLSHTCDNDLCCNPAHLYVFGDEVYQKLIEDKFWANVDKNGPLPTGKPCAGNCWTWLGKARTNGGYGKIAIGGTEIRAHRFSYELTYGNIPESLYVCHKCDNPLCVNPAHLFAGTDLDNIQDMVDKERNARGELTGTAKLTDAAVKDIRTSIVKPILLAHKYGVKRGQIYNVRKKRAWKHIK